MKATYYVIAISYGQNTEYWNSAFVNDDKTTNYIEQAEWFDTIESAQKELENSVKPFGIEQYWNVSYSIEKIQMERI